MKSIAFINRYRWRRKTNKLGWEDKGTHTNTCIVGHRLKNYRGKNPHKSHS